MARTTWIGLWRWTWRLAGAIAAFVVVAAPALTFEQHLARLRAERLRSQMQHVRIGMDYEKALDILTEGTVTIDGSCNKEGCDIQVSQRNFVSEVVYLVLRHDQLAGAFHRVRGDAIPQWIGGRLCGVSVHLSIHNRVVAEKSFSLLLAVPSWPAGKNQSLELSGVAVTRPSNAWRPANHPDYVFTSPSVCHNCKELEVRFTPDATPADVQRLSQFGFSCMESWRVCTDVSDILPAAAKESAEEEKTDQKQP